jgi:CRISPR-associated protein Cas1
MSDHRVLVIESGARLSVDNGRLKITTEAGAPAFVPPADIAAVCIDNPAAALTGAALATLALGGAAVLVSDDRHLPVSLTLPTNRASALPFRLHQQIKLSTTRTAARVWQQIVSAKLVMQAQTLRMAGRKGALRLERLAALDGADNPSAAESQGARHYFRHLFDGDFKRQKMYAEDAVNIRLNYGYAVVRALVARSMASHGLTLSLGFGHVNQENPLNLVDDFMEPFRPLVDYRVAQLAETWHGAPPLFRGVEKKLLLEILAMEVRLAGQDWRLASGVAQTVQSFLRLLEGADDRLSLPCGFRAA